MTETRIPALILKMLAKSTKRTYLTSRPAPLTCKNYFFYPRAGFGTKTKERS